MMREGLTAILRHQADFEVVGGTATGREALELAKSKSPDVVVLDVDLPDLNGLEVLRLLKLADPATRVIILSADCAPEVVSEAIKRGVHGYLLKVNAPSELAQAIQAAMRGQTHLSPEVSQVVLHDYRERLGREKDLGLAMLSERELEVLRRIAEGQSTKEIAASLTLSSKTIETHRQHIMTKTGCESVADLTRFAIRKGLISL